MLSGRSLDKLSVESSIVEGFSGRHGNANSCCFLRVRPARSCVYPMFVFAAHTGARRWEIVRALSSDVDLSGGVVTIREKKRDRTRLTTRRVPLTPFLKDVLVFPHSFLSALAS